MLNRNITHDVVRGSNLDLILRGANGVGNKFADAVGKGLMAIALALSTTDDNSAAIAKLTDELKASNNALDEAIRRNTL